MLAAIDFGVDMQQLEANLLQCLATGGLNAASVTRSKSPLCLFFCAAAVLSSYAHQYDHALVICCRAERLLQLGYGCLHSSLSISGKLKESLIAKSMQCLRSSKPQLISPSGTFTTPLCLAATE